MKLTAWEQFPNSVRKAWMVMRLSSFFILFFCLHLAARTTAQRVTLSSSGISMEQFLSQLEKQTPYSFLMMDGLISPTQKIDIHVDDAPLESVLNQVLKPLGLTYRIDNKAVYILKATKTLSSGAGSSQFDSVPHQITVNGKVTDSLGIPLSGASVTVRGSKRGTISDANGNFVLTGITENTTIKISFTGYLSKEYKANTAGTLNIFLSRLSNPLDEIQIIAYGTTTKRLNTGDVTTVTSETIGQQPVSNPLEALEGRVPGLLITQNTGVPGGSFSVQIRGQNSIANGNDPLYIIDGVPYTSVSLASLNIGAVTQGGNPLNNINPADIQSIEILKDADATAIYGSRGANGVILIDTKKGIAGKTRFTVNQNFGMGKVTRQMKLLNTPNYLEMRNEAYKNDSISPTTSDGWDILLWDSTRNTN
jgi:TonB-dependent SusC/RagA subfamily outer membrane receptor